MMMHADRLIQLIHYYYCDLVLQDKSGNQQAYIITRYDTKITNCHSKLTKHVFKTTGKYNPTTQL